MPKKSTLYAGTVDGRYYIRVNDAASYFMMYVTSEELQKLRNQIDSLLPNDNVILPLELPEAFCKALLDWRAGGSIQNCYDDLYRALKNA